MSQFHNIPADEMHSFLIGNGFKLLNPPRGRPLPSYVHPEHVTKNPPTEFYGGPNHPPTLELVYGRRVTMQASDRQLTLRVYTTIDANGTREKGSDAIRIVLFYRHVENGVAERPRIIGGERKCLRVKGWKANIQSRIDKWPEMIGPPCPKCQGPTAERDGPRGKFWGCIRYSKQGPSCNGTINFGQENAPRCSCGKVMVERTGTKGKFLGCTGYPVCRNTQNIPQTA